MQKLCLGCSSQNTVNPHDGSESRKASVTFVKHMVRLWRLALRYVAIALICSPLMGYSDPNAHKWNVCRGITPPYCPGQLAQPIGGSVMQTKVENGRWINSASKFTLDLGNSQRATITIQRTPATMGNGALCISLLKYENGVNDQQWGDEGRTPYNIRKHSLHDFSIGGTGPVTFTVEGGRATRYRGGAPTDTGLTRNCTIRDFGSYTKSFNVLDGMVQFALFTSGAIADETTGFSIDCKIEKYGDYPPDEDPGDFIRRGQSGGYEPPNKKGPDEVDVTFITKYDGSTITYGARNAANTQSQVRYKKGVPFGSKLPGIDLPTQKTPKSEGTLTFMGWREWEGSPYISADSLTPEHDTTYYADIKTILECSASDMYKIPSKMEGGESYSIYVGGAMKISPESKAGNLLKTFLEHSTGELKITTTGGAYLDLSELDSEWVAKENSWGTASGEVVTKDTLLLPGETTLVRKPKETDGTPQAVSFNSNGGLFDFTKQQSSTLLPGLVQQTVTGSTKSPLSALMPQDPISPGMDFKGWFTQPSGGVEIKSTDPIASNIKTLYAQFNPSESLAVALGVGDMGQKTMPTVIELSDKVKEARTAVPNKPGYEFMGYSTSKTGATGYVIDNTGKTTTSCQELINQLLGKSDASTTTWNARLAGSGATAGVTSSTSPATPSAALYAVYKSVAETASSGGRSVAASTGTSVLLDKQGGSGGSSSVMATVGASLPSILIPAKLGYAFMGYYSLQNGLGLQYIDKNGRGVFKVTYLPAKGTMTLYAYWKVSKPGLMMQKSSDVRVSAQESSPLTGERSCKVLFDPMGGTCPIAEQVLTCGSPYDAATLPTPVWEGRVFAGWWTDNIVGERIVSGSLVPMTLETTLFARWESKDCQITLDANGGMSDVQALVLLSGSNYVGLPVPTRLGCTFDGWYTAAIGGDRVDESAVVTADATLYAHWSVKVTFVGAGDDEPAVIRSYAPGERFGTLPVPQESQDVFIGWFRNEDQKVAADDIVPEGDVVISACWIGESEINGMNWSYEIFGTNKLSITGLKDTRSAEGCHPEFVEIPSGIFGKPVTGMTGLGLGEGNLQTREIAIPDGIREIPRHFFNSWYRLESLVYPSGLTSDFEGRPVLSECSSLRQVVFPQGVEFITDEAMLNCTSLARVVVGKDVRVIGRDSFAGCPSNLVVRFWGAPPAGLPVAGFKPGTSILYPRSQASAWTEELARYGLTAAVAFDDSGSGVVHVSFDACGGTVGLSDQPYSVGEQYGVLPQPVRTGYAFVGWRTGADSGEYVTAASKVQKSATKLFAAWKAADACPTISGVCATSDRTDGVRLTWKAAEGVSRYNVFRSKGFETVQLRPIATVVGTEYLDTDVQRGVSYCYWIVASNGSGSTRSATVVGCMVASVAVWPTSFTFDAEGGSGVIEICGLGSWTAHCMSPDVSLTKRSGSGSGELGFTVAASRSEVAVTNVIEILSCGIDGVTTVPVALVRKANSAPSHSTSQVSLSPKSGWSSAAFLAEDETSTVPSLTFAEGDPIFLCMGIVNEGMAEGLPALAVAHELRDADTGKTVATVRDVLDMPTLGTTGGYDHDRLPILQMLEGGRYELRSRIESLNGLAGSETDVTSCAIAFAVEPSAEVRICRDSAGSAWQLVTAEDGKTFSVRSVWPPPTGTLEIPDSVAGLKITGIEEYAFAGCQLTSVKIGASIGKVGAWAFGNIDGLESVTFKNPEIKFDIHAFEIQEDFAALSGAKFALKSLKLESDESALGWLTSDGGLRTLDLSTFERPDCKVGETVSLRLVRDGDVGVVGGLLELSRQSIQAPADGGAYEVSVTASAEMPWWTTVTAATDDLPMRGMNDGWISLVNDTGKGSGKISLKVDRNAASRSRTGTVMVRGSGASKVLTVVQAGACAPDNDDFANAQVLAGADGAVVGSAIAATLEKGEGDLEDRRLAGIGVQQMVTNTVWYSWKALSSCLVELGLKSEGKQELRVFRGESLQSLESVATRRFSGLESERTLRFTAQAGVTYFIRVGMVRDVFTLWEVCGAVFSLSWKSNVGPKRLYVDPTNGNDENDGETSETGKRTIAAAIAAADDRMEIIVADGVYPPVSMTGRFPQEDEIIPIFVERETKKVTIRSLNGPDRAVIDGQGTSPCVFGDNRCTISGFTLRNGSGTHYGGAKSAVLENCRIVDNRTTRIHYPNMDIFKSKSAAGAVSSTLRNCLVVGNVAAGGASAADGCSLEGCTVYSNTVTSTSGGCTSGVSEGSCVNCIVWANCHLGHEKPTVDNYMPSTMLSNCCTSPLPTSGSGNVDADPLLDARDYGLLDGSPCIDAGDGAGVCSETDIYGAKRIVGRCVDIGAVELDPVVVTLDPNGGVGEPLLWLCQKGRDRNLPGAIFTRNGYFMVGWSQTPEDADDVALPGMLKRYSKDTTLFAVWQKGELVVSPQSFAFGADGGEGFLAIAADVPWAILTDADWLTFDQKAGQGAANVHFAVRFNSHPTNLTTRAVVEAGGVRKTVEFSVAGYEGAGELVIRDGVLLGCRGELPSRVVVPDTVTNVAARAFAGRQDVELVKIPSSVRYLGAEAFADSSVKRVWYGGAEPSYSPDLYLGSSEDLMSYAETNGWHCGFIMTYSGEQVEWKPGSGIMKDVMKTVYLWPIVGVSRELVQEARDVNAPVTVNFQVSDNPKDVRSIVETPGLKYKLPDVSREGYYFVKWVSDDDEREIRSDTLVLGDRDVENCHAVWREVPYAIHYDGNGGEGEMTDVFTRYGVAEKCSENAFVREKCDFMGWSSSPDGQVEFSSGEDMLNLSAEFGGLATLYAVWEQHGGDDANPLITYTVAFARGEGSGASIVPMKCEAGRVYKISPCTFIPPAGKRFAGWACSNGRRYDDGMLIFDLAEPGETVTMTAIWE